jgi:hypothetical protein
MLLKMMDSAETKTMNPNTSYYLHIINKAESFKYRIKMLALDLIIYHLSNLESTHKRPVSSE